MMYVLTGEEYQRLLVAPDTVLQERNKIIQDLCCRVATHEPIAGSTKPSGCMLVTKTDHHCDRCPVSDVCPYPYKDWSK